MKTLNYSLILVSCLAIANLKKVPFHIDNQSTCSFTRVFFSEKTAKLSLPAEILPEQNVSGEISFDLGLFSGIKQWGSSQYIANCDTGRYALAIRFFFGKDHVDDISHFITTNHSPDAPFVVLPFGKTMINLDGDYIISIFNKEVYHEIPKEDNADKFSSNNHYSCCAGHNHF